MTDAAPETPYARQRALIEELIEACAAAAKSHADDLEAAPVAEARELPSRGLDRMFRAVRVGTMALVRLDQGASQARERRREDAQRQQARQGRAALRRLIVEQDWGDRDPLDVVEHLAELPDQHFEDDALATIEQLCRLLEIDPPEAKAEPEARPTPAPQRPAASPEAVGQRAREDARRHATAWTDSC